MRKYIASAVLATAVMAVPVAGFATMPQAAPAAAKKEATKTSTKPAPTHATSGVVKSVDDSTLVITKGGKKPEDMTFMLNANTHKEGAVAAGAPVSVRYHEDGKTHVATAVTVEQAKTHSSAKK